MIPHLFFYQLAVLGFVWLFVMLHSGWPSRCAVAPPKPAQFIKLRRPRSKEPKPFAGLTHKPPCALCEQEATHPTPLSSRQPEPLPPTNRRPHGIDTSRHFCPHSGCRDRGWPGLGNLRANGHPSGGPWRQFQCTACKGYVPEHQGTIFYGKRVPAALIVHGLACLAEGLGIRATARVFEVDPNTVLGWLVEAAEQLQTFAQYFLCDVHVKQLQLDELYAVLSAVKAGEVNETEAIAHLSRSPSWVWVAMDPESKVLLAIDVGDRPLAMAQRFVHHVTQVLAPACAPLLLTDGFREYVMALLTHYGHWVHPQRWRTTGPLPKPRWMPLPQLLYAQVVKTVRRRRLVRVSHRVVFGALEAVEQVLAACGWQINTAFVEPTQLGHPAACGGGGAACHHIVQGQRRLAAAAGALPSLSQFLPATCELAPAVVGSRTHQGQRVSQGVAALYTGDGGRPHRPCMVAASGLVVSGAAMAAASAGVRQREQERERRVDVSGHGDV